MLGGGTPYLAPPRTSSGLHGRRTEESVDVRVLWRAWLGAVVSLAVMLVLPGMAAAQAQNQAGLVIRFPDGQVEAMCIAFEGDTIGGDEILLRSGLNVVIDPSSGMGITVCQIEGQGCAYPQEQCFCQCMGGESCGYWNYFYHDPAGGEPGGQAWTYSPLGALLRDVRPGGMEAWVWGDGNDPPPAELTFESVCAVPTSTPEPTVEPPAATETSRPAATETRTAVVTGTTQAPRSTATQGVARATTTPVPATAMAATPPAAAIAPTMTTAAQDGAPPGGGNYWVFGLVVAALAAAGLVVWLRQRRGRA